MCSKCMEESHAGHNITTARTALFRAFDRTQSACDALVERSSRIDMTCDALSRLEEDLAADAER